MRKLLVLAVLAALTGCQGTGLFTSRQRDRDRDRDHSSRVPDPLFSPDIDEQEKLSRSRYAYMEGDRTVAPPTGSDRPSPSGR